MPSDVHFTRAQKWDLVRLSAAAVASTVFFTVPMFLAHPPEGGSQVGDHRPGAAEVATASGPNAPASTAYSSNTGSKSADEAGDVSVVTSMEFALATTPALESASAATRIRTGKPAQLRARANTAPPSASTRRRRPHSAAVSPGSSPAAASTTCGPSPRFRRPAASLDRGASPLGLPYTRPPSRVALRRDLAGALA